MEQESSEKNTSVICVKIGIKDRDYYIPMDGIEGVAVDPVVVSVPEAPEMIVGLSYKDGQIIPYIGLEKNGLVEDETGRKCGVLIKSDSGAVLGILCTRVEENVLVESEVLEAQIAEPMAQLWGSGKVDQA